MSSNPSESPLASPHASIAALCARLGIATDYEEVFGKRIAVPTESLVAVLAEFGVAAASPATAESTLAALREQDAAPTLPAVLALPADAPRWQIKLPLSAQPGRVRWRLRCEDGAASSGEADADQQNTLSIAQPLPPGYHRLTVEGLPGETLIISAPPRCYRPPAAQAGGRLWGPAIQLYALRSPRNWGMGDFSDLAVFVGLMAERGASLVGLNPLHALFSQFPGHTSPYSPSSRQMLNVLYIDPEAVDGFAQCASARQHVAAPAFQARLAALRAAPLVDHAGVAAAKFEVLRLLFEHFRTAASGLAEDFESFRAERGEALRRHALFEAVEAHLHRQAREQGFGWQAWPAAWQDPASPELQAFATSHAEELLFHEYLQWIAHRQLQHVVARCRAAGMAVGLYLDLAVSVDGGGSDAWHQRHVFACSARVGAPADEFNPSGQNWGLLPLRPDRLRQDGYRYFIDSLRASMRDAGALRIDHVMGLMRLFWIPGQGPGGAYVHYAVDEMLAILALESQRNQCLVIGEDLGTVAAEMREALASRDVLSYRLLYFERSADGGFKAPADYPEAALVAISTHDLATLHGWWRGEDLRVRLAQRLYPRAEIFEKQLQDRLQERAALLLAVHRAGLLSHEELAEMAFAELPTPAVTAAIHAFLAAAPSTLMVVQPEDFLGVVEQANLPGTTTEQPNWRRKLPLDLPALAESQAIAAMAQTMQAARPIHKS